MCIMPLSAHVTILNLAEIHWSVNAIRLKYSMPLMISFIVDRSLSIIDAVGYDKAFFPKIIVNKVIFSQNLTGGILAMLKTICH